MKVFNRHVVRVSLLLLAVVMQVFMVGCSDKDDEREAVSRPQCELSSIEVTVGGTVENRILNSSVVELTSAPECVNAYVDGTVLIVSGVKAGKGTIGLMADGQRIGCGVTVIDIPSDRPDTETPEEVAAQLDDISLRMSIGHLALCYDSVGTVFVLSADSRTLSVSSIVTGECMTVTFPTALTQEMAIGSIQETDVAVTLNGATLPLSNAEISRVTETRAWFHFVTSGGEAVWVVSPIGAEAVAW